MQVTIAIHTCLRRLRASLPYVHVFSPLCYHVAHPCLAFLPHCGLPCSPHIRVFSASTLHPHPTPHKPALICVSFLGGFAVFILVTRSDRSCHALDCSRCHYHQSPLSFPRGFAPPLPHYAQDLLTTVREPLFSLSSVISTCLSLLRPLFISCHPLFLPGCLLAFGGTPYFRFFLHPRCF